MAVTKVRSSKEATLDANEKLNHNDNDDYCAIEDNLIRKRLKELDPEFMKYVNERYSDLIEASMV